MIKTTLSILAAVTLLAGCESAADIASRNASKAADQFEVDRRVVFYNGITGGYILVIEGKCSIGNNDTVGKLSITCLTAPGTVKKHFLGLSDNVTFFVEQLEPNKVSLYHYRVIFKPQSIIPDIDIEGSAGALTDIVK